MDVDLLLMDEPLSALDLELREGLQDLLLKQWQSRGYAQVIVTHSIDEAVYLGRRILVMCPRPGRIVAEIPNPRAGSIGYRATAEYFATVAEVRKALLGNAEPFVSSKMEEQGSSESSPASAPETPEGTTPPASSPTGDEDGT